MIKYKVGRDQIIQAPYRLGLFNVTYCDLLFMVNIVKAVECGVKSLATEVR